MKNLKSNFVFLICAFSIQGNIADAQSLMAFKTKALEEKPIEAPKPAELNTPKQYSIVNQAIIDANKNLISDKNDKIASQYSKNNDLPYEALDSSKTMLYRANPYGPLRQRFYKVPMDVVAVENIEPVENNIKTNLPRGPFKAIYQDTKTAIIKDIPVAIADALPWVDKDKKNKDYEIVLKQVADSLNRAKTADPEWVLPAKDELFELYKKLEEMPAPPQIKEEYQFSAKSETANIDERPFKKRPIWPGAKTNVEVSVRPISITNNGLDDQFNHYTNEENLEEDFENKDIKEVKSVDKKAKPHVKPVVKAAKKPIEKKSHH